MRISPWEEGEGAICDMASSVPAWRSPPNMKGALDGAALEILRDVLLVSDHTCRMMVLSSSRRRRRVSSTPAVAKPVCCSNEPHTPTAAAEANTEHHLCTCSAAGAMHMLWDLGVLGTSFTRQ